MNTSKKIREAKTAGQAAPSPPSPSTTNPAGKPGVGSKGEGSGGGHPLGPRGGNDFQGKRGRRDQGNKEPREGNHSKADGKSPSFFTKGAHGKPSESGAFARMANPVKSSTASWGSVGSPMSYADMVRTQQGNGNHLNVAKPETSESAVVAPSFKTSVPLSVEELPTCESVGDIAVKSVHTESVPTSARLKPQACQEEVKSRSVTPVAPPAISVPPTPPPAEPPRQSVPPPPPPPPVAAYYVLEIDRVESVKFPESLADGFADVYYTFSATPGAPPPVPPTPQSAAVVSSPLHTQALPPPPPPPQIVPSQGHHLYAPHEALMQRNFAFNPLFQPGTGMPTAAMGLPQPDWSSRFPNSAGMQYSSHSPNNVVHRQTFMPRMPRDFSDPRAIRQNNSGSVW